MPILAAMRLLWGGLILLIAALVLRRVLRLSSKAEVRPAFKQLHAEYKALYASIQTELETQVGILSVVLNDAIEERNSGRPDIAWRLVRLSVSEWERVAGIIAALAAAIQKNMAQLYAIAPYRSTVSRHFRSQTMINHSRMPELLTQLVFPAKRRFQIQVDMLRRAALKLSAEFYRAYDYGERTEDQSPEVWQRLDFYLHDFDLLGKEALLALRACLMSLPESALKSFSADLDLILRRGVRTASVSADE